MSVNFSKSPVWMIAVIVGLIAATALVAGYVDRPGSETQVAAAADGKCATCPKAGTEDCCKVAGTCTKGSCEADGAASTCTAGAGTCAQKADDTGSTCPMKAAAASGCTGGQCPATQ